MSDRCPVNACTNRLGVTRQGDPWAFCRKHWQRLPVDRQYQLWRAYRSWQRLERQYLGLLPDMRPPALLAARASAVQTYIDIRDDCIRHVSEGEPQQMEMA
jgi:hypothetical protein